MRRIHKLTGWLGDLRRRLIEDKRRGSVIIVVLALLGSLALLGFLIYTIAAQEETSSEYFADSAKVQQDSGGCSPQFDRALRQIIIGPDFEEFNSALWSGKHSLMATMFGRDLHPFNGQGINATYGSEWKPLTNYQLGERIRPTRFFAGASGQDQGLLCTVAGQSGAAEPNWDAPSPIADGTVTWSVNPNLITFVDQNYNGIADGDPNDVPAPVDLPEVQEINLSPPAWGTILDLDDATRPFPEPDVDYTYADVNNVFLQHEEQVPDGLNDPVSVVVPSFHRPQYLRALIPDPLNWYSDAVTDTRVLRPHEGHVTYTSEGDNSTLRRFYRTADGPFPLVTDPDTGEAITINGPFPFPTAVNEGIWSLYGGNMATTIDYGVDADGDGVNEAFFMDLGAPLQETPDGSQKFVPLYAITIKPLDSLVNLNTAGNLAGGVDRDGDLLFDNPLGDPLAGPGTVPYVSRSNQAVAPSEVNPCWPLVARPVLGAEGGLDSAVPADLDTALEPHRLMFRTPAENNVNPVDGVELANMEFYRLVTGAGQMLPGTPDPMVDPAIVTDVYAGRWGEDFDRLLNGLQTQNPLDFPFAGTSVDGSNNPFDDNNNSGEGFAFIHPFDYQAGGRYTLPGVFGKTRQLATIENRQFPIYTDYVTSPTLGYYQTNTLHGGVLMPGSSTTGLLVNEPTETSVEPVLAGQQQDDDIFGPAENMLQLSDNDRTGLGNPGRAVQLAPFNFGADLVGDRQEEIRKRFTSTSFDLFAYGKPVFYDPTQPLGLGDPNQQVLFPQFRTWEYGDSDGDGKGDFPPTFGFASNDPLNPFREELRQLLQFEVREPGQDDSGLLHSLQRKLSINGVLDLNPTSGDLRFRGLTPHPTGLGRDPIPYLRGTIDYPEQVAAGNLQQQEWLARYDRQRMARDIYVLLYLLGGGIDQNYTLDNSAEAIYTAVQTREMAQFAVNLVDALDEDDVCTVFEYDFNLGNGYGLNDYPYDEALNPPLLPPNDDTQPLERRLVYGVEGQQLAFNEALLLLCKRVEDGVGTPVNHDATEYDDTLARDFTFIEMENVSPNRVSFDNAAWQIVVKPADVASAVHLTERRLTITSLQPFVPAGDGGTSTRFTVGTIGDNHNTDPMSMALRPSHFRVDKNYDMMIGPNYSSIAPPKDPPPVSSPGYLSLDLMLDPVLRYRVHEPQTPGDAGDGQDVQPHDSTDPAGRDLLLLNPATVDTLVEGTVNVELQLRRRANPGRAEPILFAASNNDHRLQSADNPWIVVDTMQVPLQVFELQSTDGAPEIQNALNTVQSTVRRQPLYGPDADLELTSTPSTPFALNSLTDVNPPTVGTLPYKLWQPHYDRDYTSVMELFNLPLFGPFRDIQNTTPTDPVQIANQVTRRLGARRTPAAVWAGAPNDLGEARLVGTDTAGYRFLHPEGADSTDTATADDNLWYRLLALLEVPSRSHQDAASPEVMQIGRIGTVPAPQYFRSPGRIDLNTLRHHEVLAAILDDQEVIRNDELDTSGAATNKAYLTDLAGDPASVGGTRRDWWEQFLLARDGNDPFTLLSLPGSPAAKPFRSLGFSLYGTNSLENTIFRHLPKDENLVDVPPTPDTRRRLFELGTEAEHDGDPSAPAQPVIDYDVRHRLLQKIYNNTTNRSNVFAVFITVGYFEAAEVTDPGGSGRPVVRIGSELTGDAFERCRGFFVIDRSRALDLIQNEHLPTTHDDPVTATPKFTYNFDRSFPWESLILYRQLLP